MQIVSLPRNLFVVLALVCLSVSALAAPTGTTALPAPAFRTQSLDGQWQIAKDPSDAGKSGNWFQVAAFPLAASHPIQVPGNVNEAWPNSGITYHNSTPFIFWYTRTFTPAMPKLTDLRYYLRFGAVSYSCDVWLNGVQIGSHEGGQSPFEFDVTPQLVLNQPNTITVRVVSAFMGGINQHVTLAAQPTVRIKDVFARPDIKTGTFHVEVTLENNSSSPANVALIANYGEFKPARALGTVTSKASAPPGESTTTLIIALKHPRLWNLNDPFLYTMRVTSDWNGAGSKPARHDEYTLRTGLRDFRMVNGYFQLNGHRIFVKCAHSNWNDPIAIQGTARTMKFLSRDYPQMKLAGFNMMRFIVASALPEQLDQADELGFLIYSEHESSWNWPNPANYGLSLNQVVRRDRNHPCLVIWGLLNEQPGGDLYNRAKAWLPSLRAIDDSRLVLLSSGRWDSDFHTGSLSNPGSATWDVYEGGEDPVSPVPTGGLATEIGAFHDGTGDAHVYNRYPITWSFITSFANLGRNAKPFFLGEAGMGTSYNPIKEKRKMLEAGAPPDAFAWRWINPAVDGLQQAWKKYDLSGLYPSIEDMLIDSEISGSRQREIMFNIARSNPKVNGYNLTSITDAWGAGEGFMDNFRAFKSGHLAVLQAGWSPLRWCLFVNPMNAYADQPIHLKVSLANEDILPAGDCPALLRISGKQGEVWEKPIHVKLQAGPTSPFAYDVLDQDVSIPNLTAGTYTLAAFLPNRQNAASHTLSFTVASKNSLPNNLGPVTMLGVNGPVRDLLTRQGATLHDYTAGEQIDREVIVVGDAGPGDAAAWRTIYTRIARGAHAVFLSPGVFNGKAGPNTWLAISSKGDQIGDFDWLYHKDIIAKNDAMMAGLQTKFMTPDFYGEMLSNTRYFHNVTPPDDTACVAIHCTFEGSDFSYTDGVMLGTYKLGAGRFTINAFNLNGSIGNPAADRLLLNLVATAKSDAAISQPLPIGYDAQLDALGLKN